jgi:hypothetical protein
MKVFISFLLLILSPFAYAQSIGAKTQVETRGIIALELVGKWCYLDASSVNSGEISSDECITVNGDGTYEYYFDSSGSSAGNNQFGDQSFNGIIDGQSQDRGTWRLDGNILYIQSEARGMQTFTLQKMNHPKNGNPMIVISGRTYITFYQKPGW